MWIGFIWLRIGTGDTRLGTRYVEDGDCLGYPSVPLASQGHISVVINTALNSSTSRHVGDMPIFALTWDQGNALYHCTVCWNLMIL
jgi:hypothetical protein